MAVSNLAKYGVVLGSSLTGAASGFAYSGKALTLRAGLEKWGTKLLRPSDPLWMYSRILTQKKDKLKELKEVKNTQLPATTNSGSSQQQAKDKLDLQKLKEFTNTAEGTEPTEDQSIALLNWCQGKLSTAQFSWSWEKDVTTFCEYPDWAKED